MLLLAVVFSSKVLVAPKAAPSQHSKLSSTEQRHMGCAWCTHTASVGMVAAVSWPHKMQLSHRNPRGTLMQQYVTAMPLAALVAHAMGISFAGRLEVLAHSPEDDLGFACGSAMRTI